MRKVPQTWGTSYKTPCKPDVFGATINTMSPFFRGDDDVCDHRKFKRAGLEATGLFWLSVAYASKYLTDGHVDHDFIEEKVPSKQKRDKLLDVLVEQQLFEPNGTGFLIHDYHDYNPTRDEVLAKREERAKAGRKGGQRSGVARRAS